MNWRPIRIGVYWYATRHDETSTRNFVLREAASVYCAQLNAPSSTKQRRAG